MRRKVTAAAAAAADFPVSPVLYLQVRSLRMAPDVIRDVLEGVLPFMCKDMYALLPLTLLCQLLQVRSLRMAPDVIRDVLLALLPVTCKRPTCNLVSVYAMAYTHGCCVLSC
jgi:hypothetical protein